MTIPEKIDLEPRTIGLFQRHDPTTSLAGITSIDKQTKEKENDRFSHFSSIMEVSKRPAQIQEVGPMKKKAGGREIFFHSPILDRKVWALTLALFDIAPAAPRILRSMSVSINDGFAPPANFALVGGGGVYRSSFPRVENFGYLKRLGLKSVL